MALRAHGRAADLADPRLRGAPAILESVTPLGVRRFDFALHSGSALHGHGKGARVGARRLGRCRDTIRSLQAGPQPDVPDGQACVFSEVAATQEAIVDAHPPSDTGFALRGASAV